MPIHCWRYLVQSRWPEGFRCPACGSGEAWTLPRRALFECRSCRHQTSVTAGTILHRTRLPLSLWFAAAYLVTTHTPGFSALQLQRQRSGRLRLAVVPDLAAASPDTFVAAAVEPGSILLTDAWQGYTPLRDRYDHRPVTVGPGV
jgi:hypothetical protein